MKRELMMLAGMMSIAGAIRAGGGDLMAIDDDPHPVGASKPRTTATPLAGPKPERKEKSASLKRLLKRKGRA